MFKKFTREENITSVSQVKSSVARQIRSQIAEQYPLIEPILDEIIPKKSPLLIVKCSNHISLLVVDKEVLFFQEREGPFFPHLKLLHKYPKMLPHMQVDRGAVKFILSGANIMCPGLTSPGARMDEVPEGAPVAIMVEGKEHALAVGQTVMSSADIAKINKGIGVNNMHYLGDGLWELKNVE